MVREPREATWGGKGDGGHVTIGGIDGGSDTDSGGGDWESFMD